MIFSKGKDFLRHIALGQVKRIRVQVNKLYKLDLEYCVSFSKKVEKVQSLYIGEFWNRILGHLHHRALNHAAYFYNTSQGYIIAERHM